MDRDSQYYYVVVPYAYNNYEDFDPVMVSGQQYPYLEGEFDNMTSSVTVVSTVDSLIQNDASFNFLSRINSFEITNANVDLQVSLHLLSGNTIDHWDLDKGNTFDFEIESQYASRIYIVRVQSKKDRSIRSFKVVRIN